jgi:thiosulfate dehydrogenase (quinone) large subunit
MLAEAPTKRETKEVAGRRSIMQARNPSFSAVPSRRSDLYPLDSGAVPAAKTAAASRGAVWGFAVVLLLLAYEWLLSGTNKLISGDFRSGLAGELSDAAANNPRGWYAHFLTGIVIPHAAAFGLLVECGEIAVGLGLLLAAARWVGAERIGARLAARVDVIAIAALAGSALMSCNFLLMSGDPLPWLNSGAPFDEGVGIDCLLALIAIGLIVVHVLALRDDRRPARATAQ